MERRNYAVGRRERRRLSNSPDIIFQSLDGNRQLRVAYKGSARISGLGEILTHTFVRDGSGNFVPNGEFTRFPNTSLNRDGLFGVTARKGCYQRLSRVEINE